MVAGRRIYNYRGSNAIAEKGDTGAVCHDGSGVECVPPVHETASVPKEHRQKRAKEGISHDS